MTPEKAARLLRQANPDSDISRLKAGGGKSLNFGGAIDIDARPQTIKGLAYHGPASIEASYNGKEGLNIPRVTPPELMGQPLIGSAASQAAPAPMQ